MARAVAADSGRPSGSLGGHSWPWSLALALALSAAAPYLYGLFDGVEPIASFKGRAIGRVVLEGLDVSGYAENYVLLWTLALAVFLLAGAAFTYLRDALVRAAAPGALDPEYRGLARFSELAVVFMLLRLWSGDDRLLLLRGFVDRLLVLLLLFVVAKVVLLARTGSGTGSNRRVLRWVLTDSDFLVALLFVPPPLLFAGYLATGLPLDFADRALVLAMATWAVLLAAFVVLVARRCRGLSDAEAAAKLASAEWGMALAAAPLACVPLAVALANELQSFARSFDPRTLFWLCAAALAAASGVLAVLQLRTRRDGSQAHGNSGPPSVRRLVHYVYLPLLVVTVAVFTSHVHVWTIDRLDYFHLGEKALPIQQLFEHGLLPQVDLRLTHSFSDVAYGLLYAIFSGDFGLDTQVWERWLPTVAALLVLYLFLARTLSPAFSAMVCCLLPITGVAPAYYAPALVPALCLAFAVERPSWRRWLVVWFAGGGLLLWRIDFGLAGGVALAVAVATFLVWSPRRRWRAVAVSLAGFAAGSLALLLVCSLLLGVSLFEVAGRLFGSYASRLVTRTRAQIIKDFDLAAVLQYYLLPAVAALHVSYLATQRWLRRFELAPQHFQLLYVAAFSLVISLRSLERHSLSELFNPYLFVLLLALTPVLLLSGEPRERTWVRAGFLATVVAFGLFALPPAGYHRTPNQALRLVKDGPIFELHRWQPGEPRVRYDDSRHRPFVDLLAARLDDGQTFYDFTNSPLLYVFTGRRYPTWVIPNLIQTSEGVQARVIADLDRLREAGLLPLVVFKQSHPFWDATDGVPNEIRSYRIAEYVYRHYEPWVRVGSYELWQATGGRGLDGTDPGDERATTGARWPLAAADQPAFHDLRLLPAEVGWRVETWGTDPFLHRFVDLDSLPALDRLRGHHLRIEYRSPRVGFLDFRFATDGRPFDDLHKVTLHLPATSGDRTRVASVPLKVAGQARRWTDLRLDPPRHVTFEVTGISVVERPIEVLDAPSRIEQDFDLVRLPQVWAQLDPLEARTRTEVLASLQVEPVTLAAGETVSWQVAPGLDRSRGNYLHLRIRPEPVRPPSGPTSAAQLEVRYGADLVDGFRFEAEGESRTHLPLTGAARLRDVEILPLAATRTVYRAGAGRPRVGGAVDLRGAPELAAGERTLLHLHYRAAQAEAPIEVRFGFDGEAIGDDAPQATIDVAEVAGSDPGAVAWLALPDGAGPRRLSDLSFDLAPGSLFEILRVDLVTARASDHLIRTSTQWRWWAQPVERITLRTDRPMRVEGAWIRSGD